MNEGERFGSPLPEGVFLIFVEMDWAHGTCRFVRSDGKEAVLSNSPFPRFSDVIVKSTYFMKINRIMLETERGDLLGAELPTLDSMSPKNGRPVIYLDQKDWSSLANAIHGRDRLAPAERRAADELIELARARKIILPMSSAHMAETCKWTDSSRRYRLALTISQLSGGWQMHDPLTVRRDEFRRSLRYRYGPAQSGAMQDVFTLAPNAIHSSRGRNRPLEAHEELPPDLQLAADAMSSISSHFSVMLDREHIEQGKTPGWVEKFQFITDWLAQQGHNGQQKRRSTDVYFLDDARKEIAEEARNAGLTVQQLQNWIHGPWKDDVAQMPCLGLYREVLHEKQVNGGTGWNTNDLTDLMYLTCAAGYADHVVAERSAISQLKQASKRLKRTISLYRNLDELISSGALDELY
ncbi:hypothetical protein DFO47_103505 [Arthrobacter sp. AG258]|uniref:hypothetical protein n=1 Tax=Arthrobacter sp. AG258 TaxID=2183899 RepID=UPI00105D2F25|nr:hypothetical protein [Arthrobacter sp. AG258]TDT81847.1 hypothetical protein DFO47_103505 [Arthrobacter sp. AG258]